MVEVNNTLLDALWTSVDLGVFLALAPCQPVQTKQISILGLYDVFFGGVSKRGAEVDKVGCITDGSRDGCCLVSSLAVSNMWTERYPYTSSSALLFFAPD